jgi:hypothetical protein
MKQFPELVCLVVVAVLALAPSAGADVGVGVIAGEPTGLSFKLWGDGASGLDAASGWSFGDEGRLYLHADYLWQRMIEDREIGGTVPFYFGVGGRVLLREGRDSRLGIRIPLGLDYFFEEGRFNVFVELAPIIDLVPETEFDLSGGVGLRFLFGGY